MEVFDVVNEMGLTTFDYVLFGDGSGTTADKPCGWACYVADNMRRVITRHCGGCSNGTNNLAELVPYLLALWHINALDPHRASITRIAIVTDSEVTARCGSRQYDRRANASLWASIEWFEANGFEITWKHVRRNTNPVNADCDLIAGKVRKLIVAESA